MSDARRQLVLLLALAMLAGCAGPLQKGKSMLAPARMSSDSVVLDMFFVRFSFGDPTINEKLWQEIDEQQFAPELRERLARNGFRVGVIAGQLPVELSKLMELSDKPAPTGNMETVNVADLESQPRVVRRHLQLPAGKRREIIASSIYPELTVLLSKSDWLSGYNYNQAQGIFSAKSFPQPDGRVRLELVPELHHDQPQSRFVAGQGMLLLDTSKPKEVYDDMTIAADLQPGAMMVLSSIPSRQGSLGHYFFTDNNGCLEQRLLIVRLSQTQNTELFRPPEPPLDLEE